MKRREKQHHVAAQLLTGIIFGKDEFANQTDPDCGLVSARVSARKKATVIKVPKRVTNMRRAAMLVIARLTVAPT
jgi:hypothetical protein